MRTVRANNNRRHSESQQQQAAQSQQQEAVPPLTAQRTEQLGPAGTPTIRTLYVAELSELPVEPVHLKLYHPIGSSPASMLMVCFQPAVCIPEEAAPACVTCVMVDLLADCGTWPSMTCQVIDGSLTLWTAHCNCNLVLNPIVRLYC